MPRLRSVQDISVIVDETASCLVVPVDCIVGKRRYTDGDVFSAGRLRCAVTDPLAGAGHHGLPGMNTECSVLVLDTQ